MLEEELLHLEFKCHNILPAQKKQQLCEFCMKAWLLEEVNLYDLAASEPPKHELSDISELPETSDKDSTTLGKLPEHSAAHGAFARDPPEVICCW